jgi:hypothetical protein
MEQIGLENLAVTELCGRMTLDAIGLAGFGKNILYIISIL